MTADAAGERVAMHGRHKLLLSWSTGKDSAWALHVLRRDPRYQVCGLVTTVNVTHRRVAMHATRIRLLQAQASAVGLPLHIVSIPHPCTNAAYESAFAHALREAASGDVVAVAFGDLYLPDVREYRERLVGAAGLASVFPLWGCDTASLAHEMIGAGLRARLTCVDPRLCSRELVGREFDDSLLGELAGDVDPCGENGEFHTFAYDGPMFGAPIAVSAGAVVEREGFVFADLIPAPEQGVPASGRARDSA